MKKRLAKKILTNPGKYSWYQTREAITKLLRRRKWGHREKATARGILYDLEVGNLQDLASGKVRPRKWSDSSWWSVLRGRSR